MAQMLTPENIKKSSTHFNSLFFMYIVKTPV